MVGGQKKGVGEVELRHVDPIGLGSDLQHHLQTLHTLHCGQGRQHQGLLGRTQILIGHEFLDELLIDSGFLQRLGVLGPKLLRIQGPDGVVDPLEVVDARDARNRHELHAEIGRSIDM